MVRNTGNRKNTVVVACFQPSHFATLSLGCYSQWHKLPRDLHCLSSVMLSPAMHKIDGQRLVALTHILLFMNSRDHNLKNDARNNLAKEGYIDIFVL